MLSKKVQGTQDEKLFRYFYQKILGKHRDIKISEYVQYRDHGLYAKRKIQKNQIVIIKPLSSCISYKTILQSFKKIFNFSKIQLSKKQQLNLPQKYWLETKKEQLQLLKRIRQNQLNMDQNQIVILLYLIFLKLIAQKSQPFRRLGPIHSQEVDKKDRMLSEWILTANKTYGFGLFDPQTIMESKDQNIIIQYHAYRNGIKSFSRSLKQFIKLCCKRAQKSIYQLEVNSNQHDILKIRSNLTKQIHQRDVQIDGKQSEYNEYQINQQRLIYILFEQVLGKQTKLDELIFQCIQIKNTRSFGYADQTQIIPFIDYLNHSSRQNVQLKYLTEEEINFDSKVKLFQDQNHNSKLIKLIQIDTNQKAENYLTSNLLNKNKNQYVNQVQFKIQPIDQSIDQLTSEDDDESYQIQGNNRQNKCSKDNLTQIKEQKKRLNWIVIKSKRQIEQNEQLVVNYGNRNNQYFLKWYGFVEENNFCDSLKIYIDNYQDKIYFDPIQRTTQLFKFKWNKNIPYYSKKDKEFNCLIQDYFVSNRQIILKEQKYLGKNKIFLQDLNQLPQRLNLILTQIKIVIQTFLQFSRIKCSNEIFRMIEFFKIKFNQSAPTNNKIIFFENQLKNLIQIDFEVQIIQKVIKIFQNPINYPPYKTQKKSLIQSNLTQINQNTIHFQSNYCAEEVIFLDKISGQFWIEKYHKIQEQILNYVVWNLSIYRKILIHISLLRLTLKHALLSKEKNKIMEGIKKKLQKFKENYFFQFQFKNHLVNRINNFLKIILNIQFEANFKQF